MYIVSIARSACFLLGLFLLYRVCFFENILEFTRLFVPDCKKAGKQAKTPDPLGRRLFFEFLFHFFDQLVFIRS